MGSGRRERRDIKKGGMGERTKGIGGPDKRLSRSKIEVKNNEGKPERHRRRRKERARELSVGLWVRIVYVTCSQPVKNL